MPVTETVAAPLAKIEPPFPKNTPAEFVLVPCDGLAAAIENDDQPLIHELCSRYTREVCCFGTGLGEIDTLVLGCTHYPLLKSLIADIVGPAVRLIDSAEETAADTRRMLTDQSLHAAGSHEVRYRFIASDDQAQFLALGQRFFGDTIERVELRTFG